MPAGTAGENRRMTRSGGMSRGLETADVPKLVKMVEEGQVWLRCTVCSGVEGREMGLDEVVGIEKGNRDLWHRGHFGHKVEVIHSRRIGEAEDA